jgi:hypothetical protein
MLTTQSPSALVSRSLPWPSIPSQLTTPPPKWLKQPFKSLRKLIPEFTHGGAEHAAHGSRSQGLRVWTVICEAVAPQMNIFVGLLIDELKSIYIHYVTNENLLKVWLELKNNPHYNETSPHLLAYLQQSGYPISPELHTALTS